MVKLIFNIIFTVIICSSTVFWPAFAEVKEVQHAECTLISGDVKASAEASVSWKLENYCATDHLSRAFGNLENRLLTEINYLRTMINLLLPPLYQQHYFAQPNPQLYEAFLTTTTTTTPTTTTKTTTSTTKTTTTTTTPPPADANASPMTNGTIESSSQPIDKFESNVKAPMVTTNSTNSKETTLSDEGVTEMVTERQLKFKPVQKKVNDRKRQSARPKTGPREFEIHKFNNTILSGTDLEIFTYYWKIEQFSSKLKSNVSILTSPMFSIAGLYLQVEASFNHLGRDYLNLKLDQVAIDDGGEQSNIILKAGDMFKKIETKISLKHKITILDQVTPTNDLISPEFANTNQGFLVPNSAILSGPFAKGDNLLIKVVMTL